MIEFTSAIGPLAMWFGPAAGDREASKSADSTGPDAATEDVDRRPEPDPRTAAPLTGRPSWTWTTRPGGGRRGYR